MSKVTLVVIGPWISYIYTVTLVLLGPKMSDEYSNIGCIISPYLR